MSLNLQFPIKTLKPIEAFRWKVHPSSTPHNKHFYGNDFWWDCQAKLLAFSILTMLIKFWTLLYQSLLSIQMFLSFKLLEEKLWAGKQLPVPLVPFFFKHTPNITVLLHLCIESTTLHRFRKTEAQYECNAAIFTGISKIYSCSLNSMDMNYKGLIVEKVFQQICSKIFRRIATL